MIDNSKQWCFTSSRSFPSPLKKKKRKKVGKLRCLEDLPTDNLRFQRRVFFSVSLSRWWNKEDFPTCQEKNTHRKNFIHSDFHSHYILRRLRAALNVQSDPTAAQKLTTKNQTFEEWWWTDCKVFVSPSKTLDYTAARTDDELLNGNELCWQAPCQSGSLLKLVVVESNCA